MKVCRADRVSVVDEVVVTELKGKEFMIVKKSKALPILLSSVACIHVMSACGKRTQKSDLDIVGGRLVTSQDAGPEKVSTVGLNGCTGTIIARDLILTAAHCYPQTVQGGYVLFGIDFDGSDRKIINIAGATVNESYTGSHNDVAMLKLAKDIPAGYAPVKLLPPSLPLTAGDGVRQAGYGTDNEDAFGTLRTVESNYVGQSPEGTLVIKSGSKAACSGDSGGPLYVQKNGEWYSAGIAATATMNFRRECVGGNDYTSVIQNLSTIINMARQLSGREDPLGSGSTEPVPTPAPEDLNNSQTPIRFGVIGHLVEQNNVLSKTSQVVWYGTVSSQSHLYVNSRTALPYRMI
ncbi:MAG TPA: trypsin-like serine protease [Oligoflexus sp.]|uniref:S1 family peptidase n=1 Tax=Oligoflexus sp. TaxID=1971216 RepID=UPI002D68D229|nr:trypsin-like serine protease [Oligoflexus sp.]HYX39012.1 trypsin-like serine protease [Oligoflexus sp.]